MSHNPNDRSLAGLVTDALSQISTLFQTEVRLARTELAEKAERVVAGLGAIVGGAIFTLAALIIGLQGIVAWMVAYGFSPQLAALIVTVATGAVGAVMLTGGIAALKGDSLTPNRTIRQLQRDAAVAKEQTP